MVAMALAMVFTMARLLVAADGEIGDFVVAGDAWTDPATVEPDIDVEPGTGYDGQFFHRLAVDPTDHDVEPVAGVTLDTSYRLTRIAYPALAWAGAMGMVGLVPWALVAVNVMAIGAVAWSAASVARGCGRSPAVGIVVAGVSGLTMALSRDLSEAVMVAAFVAGVAFYLRDRWWATAAAWSVAALAHEQVVPLIFGYGIWRIHAILRRRARPGVEDAPWFLPGLGFVGWQAVLWLRIDEIPVTDAGGNNVAFPFSDLVPAVVDWVTLDRGRLGAVSLVQLAFVVAVVVVAARSIRAVPASMRWLGVSLVAAVGLAALLSESVWVGPADLRQVVIVPVAAWLVVLAARRPIPPWLLAGGAGVWLLTAGFRVALI